MHEDTRTCTKCGETKPLTEYYFHRAGQRRRDCRTCNLAHAARWRSANRAKLRAWYGITEEHYAELMAEHGRGLRHLQAARDCGSSADRAGLPAGGGPRSPLLPRSSSVREVCPRSALRSLQPGHRAVTGRPRPDRSRCCVPGIGRLILTTAGGAAESLPAVLLGTRLESE